MRRRYRWWQRRDGLFHRYEDEESTVETNCPRCVFKQGGSCAGDYEGCYKFKPKGGTHEFRQSHQGE